MVTQRFWSVTVLGRTAAEDRRLAAKTPASAPAWTSGPVTCGGKRGRTLPISAVEPSSPAGQHLPQLRLVWIERQGPLQALASGGLVAGAHLPESKRGVGRGVARVEVDGALEVGHRPDTVAGFNAIPPPEQPDLRIVGLRRRGIGEQLQRSIDASLALIADGPADQEPRAFREAVGIGAHQQRV